MGKTDGGGLTATVAILDDGGVDRRIIQVGRKFPPKPIVSPAAKDVTSQMLVKDSSQRLPLHKFLEHP
ncbi:serine/threonine-protein kinase Aurora-3 [Trifolium repens]|nr:serine/threonine-protein kinase Aurora-3 [Trifolium repens]